jgi:hypothetical protein
MENKKRMVDNFVRFIIGDRSIALLELKSLINSCLNTMDDEIEPEEYNQIYLNLYTDILAAIDKNIEIVD